MFVFLMMDFGDDGVDDVNKEVLEPAADPAPDAGADPTPGTAAAAAAAAAAADPDPIPAPGPGPAVAGGASGTAEEGTDPHAEGLVAPDVKPVMPL